MKNKKYIILALVIATLAGLTLFREPIVRAGSAAFGLTDGPSNPFNENGAVISTTTLNYMSIGAGTTTLTVGTSGTDQFDVNVFGISSSTLTDLRWRVEFSNSTTSVAANQVWFPETKIIEANATTTRVLTNSAEYSYVFASSTAHRVATSTAANNTFDQNTVFSFTFHIKDIAARWTRVVFYLPTGASTVNDDRMDTASESTAFGTIPSATSTNAAIQIFPMKKEPL